MVEIEKSKTEPEKKKESTVDAFARLRAQLRGVGNRGVANKTVYLLLDASGSMRSSCNTRGGRSMSKHDAVEAVVRDVVSSYSARVNLQIGQFSYDAMTIPNVSQYRVSGETNIQSALQLLILPGSQAVLLSDGGETCGDAKAELGRLVDQNITVNTIGVGVDYRGEQLLREIAERTGGEYAGIDSDINAIFETFKRLASKAVAALTEGGAR